MMHLIELNLEIEYTYRPPIRGVKHLAPSKCYPDESADIEISAILKNGVELPLAAFTKEELDQVREQIEEYEG